MARASRSPSRFSLPPNVHAPMAERQEPSVYEQLQRKYSEQNKVLAQTTVRLQCQNTELETELASAQREIRMLKRQNEELVALVRDKVGDLLDALGPVTGEERVLQVRSHLPSSAPQPVKEPIESITPSVEIGTESRAPVGTNYLKQINNDLRKRKSALFVSSIPEEDEETLLPTTQDLSFVEEAKEPESEPEYKDTESKMIPIKRKRDSELFGTGNRTSMVEPIQDNIPDLSTDVHFQSKRSGPDEGAKQALLSLPALEKDVPEAPVLDELDEFSIAREQNSVNPFVSSTSEESDATNSDPAPAPKKRKQPRIPRELKNLDTEKTKRWTGVDPLEGRSRRSSIAPRWEPRSRTVDVHIDAEQNDENAQQSVERKALAPKDPNTVTAPSKTAKAKATVPADMSIFDLEQQDFLDIAIPVLPVEGKKRRGRPKGSTRRRKEEFLL